MRTTRLFLTLLNRELLTLTLPNGEEINIRNERRADGRFRVCIEAPADVAVARETAKVKTPRTTRETEHAGS